MTDLSEDDDLLAAELALGVIPDPERSIAQDRARTEPAFAEAITHWQNRFAALAPGETISDLWPAIAAKVDPDRGTSPGTTLPVQLRRWKIAAAGFSMAAALLLVVQLSRPEPEQIRLAAILTGPDRAVATVGIDATRNRLIVQSSALTASLAGRVPQLWIVGPDGRPRSLGVITPDASRAVDANGGVKELLAPDATLAISIEPAGGSPTGQPTGPIVLSGKIARI